MKNQHKSGFTLVELMLVSVIASIIFSATAHFLSQNYKEHLESSKLSMTMNEIQVFQTILGKNVRSWPNSMATNANLITFSDGSGNQATLTYDSVNRSIIYDPNTSALGDQMEILKDSVIAGFTSYRSNNVVFLNVKIVEIIRETAGKKVEKTNDFIFRVSNRQ